MARHKHPRQRGKISLSKYFKKFNAGDTVAVKKEVSIPLSYSTRIQGRTGKVIDKRGSSYYIELCELGKKKKYIIHPIHLIRIQN